MTQEPLWQPSDIETVTSGEPGSENGAPKRRGRIPQAAWPRILGMYKSGATLSAIAREFDCTPSAISYIIRKAETSGTSPEDAGSPGAMGTPDSPPANAGPVADAPQPEMRPAPRAEAPHTDFPRQDPPREGNPTGGEVMRPRTEAARPDTARPELPRHSGERAGRMELPGRDGRPGGERRPDRLRPDRPQGDRPQQNGHHQGGHHQGERAPGDFRRSEQGPRGPVQGQPRPQGRPHAGDRFRGDRPQTNEFGPTERFQPDEPFSAERLGHDGEPPYPYRQQPRNAAREEAQEVPTVPADERMDTAARACAEAYRAWKASPGETGMQPLADALHELRKVMARMEIEMSASRRDEQRPIPIPTYRSNPPPPQQPRG